MSQHNWFKYAAFGGLAITALFAGAIPYLTYRQQHTQERQHAIQSDISVSRQPIAFTCENTKKGLTQCVIQSPDTEAADEHTKADLKAQQDVAEWTFAAVLISIIGLFITLIGTIYVAKSLDISGKSTMLALKAIQNDREIGQIQTRAYLQPVFNKLNYQESVSGSVGITFNGTITNFGQSPARDITVGGLFSKKDPHPLDDHIGRVHFLPISSYSAPSYVMENVSVRIPFNDHDISESDTDVIWYAIIVKFKDEFEDIQQTVIKGHFSDTDGRAVTINKLRDACISGNVLISHK